MTTIYLHIGTHKTGTTAIQRALSECQNRLLDVDVLFPSTGRAMGSVHQLAWCFLPDNPPWYPLSPLSATELYAQLHDEVKAAGRSTVVLSSEDFSLIDKDDSPDTPVLKDLKEKLSPWDVKIIVYLRPQSDYLTAFYNQVHKAFDPRFPDKSILGLMGSLQEVINYDRFLQRWASVFGKDNIIVRPFNEHRLAGNIAHDFFRLCGIDLDDVPEIQTNESLDPGLLAFRRMVNTYPSSDESKAALEKYLSAISRKKPAPIFSPERAREIMEMFREGNRKIAEDYPCMGGAALEPLVIKDAADAPEPGDSVAWEKSVKIISAVLGEVVRDLNSRLQALQENSTKETAASVNHVKNSLLERQGALEERQAALEEQQAAFEEKQGAQQVLLEARTDHIVLAAFQHAQKSVSLGRMLSRFVLSDARIIRRSGYFDEEFYLANYPDVAEAGMDPVEHYLRFGASEGRNPSASFGTIAYLSDNMGIASAGVNPLVHYIRHGCMESREGPRVNEFTGRFYDSELIGRIRKKSRLGCHVVVIDHEVPLFDTNAGARHTFHYMKLLIDLGAAVTFLPYVQTEGDINSQKRVLADAGINVLEHDDCFIGDWKADAWIPWLDNHRDQIDLVFIHRPHVANAYMAYCKQSLGITVWYMCHDLHFLRLKRQARHEKSLKLALLYLRIKAQEKTIFGMADISFTPSAFEEAYIRRHFNTDTIITLPLYVYDNVEVSARMVPDGKKITFVGSFGHDPNVDAVRWFVSRIFPLVLKCHPDAEFHIVGANPPESLLKIAGDSVIFHGFLSDPDLEALYSATRVIAIPLRYGAGVKGKVIESLVMGIPFVSTACGIEGIGSLDGLVEAKDNPNEFAAEINRLLDKNDLEEAGLSTGLKRIARERFSLGAAESLLLPCLEQCLENCRGTD